MVRSTYSSFSTLYEVPSINLKQHQRIIHQKNSWECRGLNPGLLSEKRECYLCAMPPSPIIKLACLHENFPKETLFFCRYVYQAPISRLKQNNSPCLYYIRFSDEFGWIEMRCSTLMIVHFLYCPFMIKSSKQNLNLKPYLSVWHLLRSLKWWTALLSRHFGLV